MPIPELPAAASANTSEKICQSWMKKASSGAASSMASDHCSTITLRPWLAGLRKAKLTTMEVAVATTM